jgi:DNA topoisomerase VI subunit B
MRPFQNAAVLLSLKELIENSLDASALSSGGQCKISASIYSVQSAAGMCAVEVRDNGRGMTNIAEQLRCFSTSKNQPNEITSGKFGIGLSTVMICKIIF